MQDRPRRSVLYMPGSRPRALEKARSLPADALILDLEDAVAPAEKPAAREMVAAALRAGGYGPRELVVRINALDTEWGPADLAAACAAGADAVLLPKVNGPDDLARAEALMPAGADRPRLWAMMETPLGVLNAAAIAAATPRLECMVIGTNDLAKDLGARNRPDRMPLLPALATCLLAARAHGLACIDGVYNAFRDPEGLRAECVQGRDMGFDGKTLIHPDQLAIANEVFAPSAEELEEARAQLAAWDAAQARGEGVAVWGGRIVERLHAEAARHLLARAEAIRAREAAGAG
ncbi:MAG: (3S)-malyl-CoA thioesterase [Paracoccaceae bacterium]|nr:MAG: (3S)-malyl-CoA thioesterase [Paracoccaceae bacterium]